jgi:hypothetical protein
LVVAAIIQVTLVLTASSASLSKLAAASSCLQMLLGLFSLAWWITGIVWYTEVEGAGCDEGSMKMMLAAFVSPGVVLGLACCAGCIFGQAMIKKAMGGGATSAGNLSPEQQQAMAQSFFVAMSASETSTASQVAEKDASNRA